MTGKEQFENSGKDLSLLTFWQWAYSDLWSNTLRGVLAEFIVNSALEMPNKSRIEWEPYDIVYNGFNIEVKSAAYLQSWPQKTPSKIEFDIAPKKLYSYEESSYSTDSERRADIYVFSVLNSKEKESSTPLDMTQWSFYLLRTKALNAELGAQKKLGIERLKTLFPVESSYQTLKKAVDQIISEGL